MYEKPDYYAKLAKQEGYPARSVYKLKEIDEKNGLVKPGMNILDIGAAPGSWSAYCMRKQKDRGRIVAVDPAPVEVKKDKGGRFVAIEGDILKEETRNRILEYAPFELVLSDAAPPTTGNRTVDCGRSYTLAEQVFLLGEQVISTGGAILIKIFQGGDEREIMERMKTLFSKVKMMKPKACRKGSFEVFILGTGKKE